MARTRLMARLSRPMPQQSAWLALLLVILVISLCWGQRMGLSSACAYTPTSDHATLLIDTPLLGDKAPTDDNERCSLSEQLLSKAMSQLDPLSLALLLPFAVWLFPPQLSRYCRRYPPPLLFSGRRRHLVLCVFRE